MSTVVDIIGPRVKKTALDQAGISCGWLQIMVAEGGQDPWVDVG